MIELPHQLLTALAESCADSERAISHERTVIAATPDGCPVPRASHEALFRQAEIVTATLRVLLLSLAGEPSNSDSGPAHGRADVTLSVSNVSGAASNTPPSYDRV